MRLVEHRSDEHRSEQHEGDGRQQFALVLGEVLDAGALLAGDLPERQPGNECRDEPIAVQHPGQSERPDGDGDRRELPVHALDVTGGGSMVEQAAADDAGRYPGEDSESDLPGCQLDPLGGAARRFGGGCDEQHGHDRHCDPVVQSALDVEGLADPDGESPVTDHGLSQRSVGGGQHRCEQCCLDHTEAGNDHDRQCGAGDDRQREANGEQSSGEHRLVAQHAKVDSDGVGEQHQHERRLDQNRRGLAFQLEVEPADTAGTHDDADRREHHRRRHR